ELDGGSVGRRTTTSGLAYVAAGAAGLASSGHVVDNRTALDGEPSATDVDASAASRDAVWTFNIYRVPHNVAVFNEYVGVAGPDPSTHRFPKARLNAVVADK